MHFLWFFLSLRSEIPSFSVKRNIKLPFAHSMNTMCVGLAVLQQRVVGVKGSICQINFSTNSGEVLCLVSGLKRHWVLNAGALNTLGTQKRALTINVEHHLPHGGSNGLMEAEPDLSSSPKRMVVTLRSREERAAHWSVSAEERERGGMGKISVCIEYIE